MLESRALVVAVAQHGLLAREVEVPGADYIDILRVQFNADACALRQFRGGQGGAATQERIVDECAPLEVVRIGRRISSTGF
jgi:hypothetical protein